MNDLKKYRALTAAVFVLATMAVLIAAESSDDLCRQGRQQYLKHNYKSSLALAEKILARSPEGQMLRDAQRIKALSLCHLRNRYGYQYAKGIIAEHAPFKNDAELYMAMGIDCFHRGRAKDAYESYLRAGQLFEKFEKIKNHTRSAEAYFKAAKMLTRGQFLDQPAQNKALKKNWNWQAQNIHHVNEAIKLYERIVTLKITDQLKARALFQAGECALRPGQWKQAERAIALFRRCTKEFPKTPHAAQSQFRTGQAYRRFNRFVQAIREFRLVLENFPDNAGLTKQARGCIKAIKAPQVNIYVEKSYLPNQKVKIYWDVRNIRKLHIQARSIDLTQAVGKITKADEVLSTISKADGPVVANRTFATPDAGKYQHYQHYPSTKNQTTAAIDVPLEKSGAYVIQASGVNPDGKSEKAYGLVIISKISAVAKTDSDQILVLANDAINGKPATGADVAVVRYWHRNKYLFDRATGKINDAGIADIKMPNRKNYQWLTAVKKGDDQALCSAGNYHWSWWGCHHAYKVYGFTERPVYRPGHMVHYKQVIRGHKDGVYTEAAGKKIRAQIRDPKGKVIYSRDAITDEFGAVEGDFKLPELSKSPPLGIYRISVQIDGRNYGYEAGNRFCVEEYKKPEFKVTVSAQKPDYRIGDEIKIKIQAKYYFGQPVAGADVKFTIRKQSYHHGYSWPRRWSWYHERIYSNWGYRRWRYRPRFNELVTTGTAKTDSTGCAMVTVKAKPFKGHRELDLKFVVQTEVSDPSRRVIRSTGEVKVTHAPFFVYPKPAQNVYSPGDSVEILVKTANPAGTAVAGKFTVEAWRLKRIRGEKPGIFVEKLQQKLHSQKIEIGSTGRGSFRFTPDMTGKIKIIIRQITGQKPVEGSCAFWIASPTGAEAHYAYNDLKIIPDRDQYEIGQKIKLLINTRLADSRVLLTGEADGLLFHRVVHVKKNSTLVEIDVARNLCPNFTLTATLLRDNRLLMDNKKIIVPPTHNFIKVTTSLDTGHLGGGKGNDNKYQPREKTKIRVKLTDVRTGKPVQGQVTLMMVDSSIYYIQPEFRQAIEQAFYGFVRHVRVRTTNSFHGPASLNPRGYRWGSGRQRLLYEGVACDKAGGPMLSPGRPALCAKSMNGKGFSRREAAQPKLATTIIREHFRDTVLWAGSVVTDADGTAVVPVTMPDQLTTFALHAIAFDKATRVGQAKSQAITTKRVIVRLQSGRFFTEGDKSYVTVVAHNYYDSPQKLTIDLKTSDNLKLHKVKLADGWRDYNSGQPLNVTVAAGGHARLDFQTSAVKPGEVTMLARARGKLESDAVKLIKPIVPWGARKIIANTGVMRGTKDADSQTAQFVIDVPKKIGPNSQSLTITLNPSIAAVAMESLPFLADYPYGCVEQTMSRFLPLVVMRKTLQDSGITLDDLRGHIERQIAKDPKLAAKYKLRLERMKRSPVYSANQVDRMIAKGIKRLTKLQRPHGGWGWWAGSQGDRYMTAYILYGLAVARDCDVNIPRAMINRGLGWLVLQTEKPKFTAKGNLWRRYEDNDNSRCFSLYVIGKTKPAELKKPKLAGHLDRIYRARDELTDYGRAYLALAMHAAGRKDLARIIVENFENTVTIDESASQAHWGKIRNWWYWYHGATETTAWVLQAMLTVAPDNKHVQPAVTWLVRNRKQAYWHNTKTTANVVYALARYAKISGELDCDQTYHVVIDDKISRTIRVTKANMFTFDDWVVLGPDVITPGKHTVKITRSGSGSLYWGAFLRYYDKSETIKASGHRIALKRKYFRLIPEKFTNTRGVWKNGKHVREKFPDIRYKPKPLNFGDEITTGQLIEVRITIDADENLEYVMFEDPKPAGCEPYRLRSGASYGGGVYANMELRDTKIAFFADRLRKGRRELSYKLVCEQPGTFRILPSFAQAMYCPFVEAISDSGNITITTK